MLLFCEYIAHIVRMYATNDNLAIIFVFLHLNVLIFAYYFGTVYIRKHHMVTIRQDTIGTTHIWSHTDPFAHNKELFIAFEMCRFLYAK